jgi:hypothetical protein
MTKKGFHEPLLVLCVEYHLTKIKKRPELFAGKKGQIK